MTTKQKDETLVAVIAYALVIMGVLALALGLCAIQSFLLMWAWNIALVPLFGLQAIGFWQAVALCVIADIFLGFARSRK